jgi:DNA repair protein RadC
MICETVHIRERPKTRIINNSSDAYNLVKEFTKNRQEQFIVITLNARDEVIGVHVSNIGTTTAVYNSPKEVFYKAITDNAVSIIICHNHPSRIITPSDGDYKSADRYFKAGAILGIPVKENMVISEYGYSSIKPSVEEFRKGE